jgi:GT2 family glycosyltransferase
VISVIVPTHNRSASLRRSLNALSRQTWPLEKLEVIVVADGCTDDTLQMLDAYRAPFALRVETLPGCGASTARARGTAAARGSLLIMLDDDVEASPELVAAHARVHADNADAVVIGANPPALPGRLDFVGIAGRAWWLDLFSAMNEPGHRFGYRNVLTGNLSMTPALLARAGGFDTAFTTTAEDWELGARLLKAGARLIYAADAASTHHETVNLDRSLRRVSLEGRGDVLIARRHPELTPDLLFCRTARVRGHPLNHALRMLAFRAPVLGDVLTGILRLLLPPLEWMNVRRRWRHVYYALRWYWYCRGVAGEVTLSEFSTLVASSVPEETREIEVDLANGIEAAERRLDEERPAGVRVHYHRQLLGRIPATPGCEPLRGVHLRPFLARDLAKPVIAALASEQAMLALQTEPAATLHAQGTRQ